jgi:hypothetical protein
MRATLVRLLFAGLSLTGAAEHALAHHSFATIWDETKTFVITGTLKKVDWINPHSYVTVAVKDTSGKMESYSFEGMPPNMLKRMGFSKEMLTSEIGNEITVKAFPARDGNKTLGFGQSFKFKDGRTIIIVPEGSAAPAR